MEDKEVCKCGKSHVTFECVGEDLYMHKLENIYTKKTKCAIEYYCVACDSLVATADRCMIVRWV